MLTESNVKRLGVVERNSRSGLSVMHGEDLDDLTDELHFEFSAPIALFDPVEQQIRQVRGAPSEAFVPALELRLDTVKVSIVRPENENEPLWLVLPVPSTPVGPNLLAIVGFRATDASPRSNVAWGPYCPERALRAWGQAVANRLKSNASSRASSDSAYGARHQPTIADRLIRGLRVSDQPERFQRTAVSTIQEALDVAAVAWVPGNNRDPVVVAGEVETLTPENYRSLVHLAAGEAVWVSNRPTGPNGAVRRLAIAAADSEAVPPLGGLVAGNPNDDRPFDTEVEILHTIASLIVNQRANARLYGDLKELLFGVIRALTSAIDAKDPYTSGHSERVARIAVRLGEELGLSINQRGDLYLMGLLHDVGKIGIGDEVLKKPGKLTDEEYRQIQAHVRIGFHILSDLKKLHHLLPGVAHHHECMDGSGYPSGLSGEAIPLPARILAVADAFDAMSSSRPYRRRLSPDQIDEIFRKGAGTQWDTRVVDALFACRADLEQIRQKGLGESLRKAVGDALGRS